MLNVESARSSSTKPYYPEGWTNSFKSKTMIDTGSLVTIFALDEMKIIQRKDLRVRRMIEGENYVDFNGKLLDLVRTTSN